MLGLLKTMFGWLANRWLISVLGLLLIALLIWFFGPDLAFAGRAPLAGEVARLLLIVAVVFLWGVLAVVAALRQRNTNRKVLDSLAAPPAAAADPTAAAAREEVEALGGRFHEALLTLRQARLGGKGGRFGGLLGSGRFLYQLPWYVIIGPPGSGKTTALVNSGLKFPLAEAAAKPAVRGVGGTRNCDWFFTDDAVLIDTAGRYTTQDSDAQVDRSAWTGFLELLKRHRRRRPIDGILIAFGAEDLARADPEQRLAHARAVKRRVQEIQSVLQVKPPLYVVFTKCDLVAGFNEFFADLSPEERAQVWGTTFAPAQSGQPGAVVAAFPEEFAALVDRLTDRVTERLQQERDIARRSLLLSFPQQMALLGPAVHEFLSEAFGGSRFEEAPMLRGVYFTSATQQGTPIDRVIGAVASGFGLERQAMPPFSGRGVSFFLTRLLKDVIFPEAGLVTSTRFVERNRPWLTWAAYGGLGAVAVVASLLMLGSYGTNGMYVDDVERAVDEFRGRHTTTMAGRGDVADVLGTLDALRGLAGNWGPGGESPPTMMRFGLFQGDKLAGAADEAYRRALKTMLLPRVVARLEQQVAENTDRADFLYQALKVYLMMTTPQRRDPELVQAWLRSDFDSRHPGPGNAELRADFARHLQALFDADVGAVAENEPLVARARSALLRLPLATRVYGEIRDRAMAETKGRDWTLAALVPARDLQYFQPRSGASTFPPIPRFFTVEGYQTQFLKNRSSRIDEALAETWVLGPDFERTQSDGEREDLERRVADLYFAEYIRRWDDLRKDIGLVRISNVEQQANVVRALAQPDSPLKSVLGAIALQTTLAGAAPESAPAADGVTSPKAPGVIGQSLQRLGKAEEQLRKFFGSEAQAAAAEDPAMRVDRHFAQLHEFLRGAEGKPPPIEQTLALLSELQKGLEDVQAYQAQGKDALAQLAQAGAKLKAVAGRLEGQAKFLPDPMKGMAATAAGASAALPTGAARSRIEEVWTTSVAPACQTALANRYPFVQTSTTDANLVDFARVLGPNGDIDKFAKEFVEPFADTSVRPWRWREGQGAALGISSGALRFFEDATRIRQSFFAAGGAVPAVRFDIEPVSLDPRAAQVQLDVGNQRLIYQHGPRRAETMQWPPAQGAGAMLTFVPTSNVGQTIVASRTGPWALFHLLDGARVERSGAGDRLTVSFDVQGYQAVFLIRAESVINPFSLPELRDFRCRDRL